MSRSFWFEIIGTEKYVGYSKDFKTKTELTKEEFEELKPTNSNVYIERENEDLQRVDELICEFMGEPPPDRRADSLWYYWCHEYGFLCLYKLGGHQVGDKPEHLPWLHDKLDEFLKNERDREDDGRLAEDEFHAKLGQEGYRARCHALIDWVFTKKWQFNACG